MNLLAVLRERLKARTAVEHEKAILLVVVVGLLLCSCGFASALHQAQ
jgi:hypothetical protein